MTVFYRNYDATPSFVEKVRFLRRSRDNFGMTNKPKLRKEANEQLFLIENAFAWYLTDAIARKYKDMDIESVDIHDLRTAMEALAVKDSSEITLEMWCCG